MAALPEGPLPPPDTMAGRFIRDVEARIADAEQRADHAAAAEAREALRLGRRPPRRPRHVTLA